MLLAIYDGDYYLICYERDQDDEIGTFNKIKLEEIDNVECLYDEELEGSTEFRFFDVEDIFTGKYLPNTERMNSAILAEYPDAELLAPKETVRLKVKNYCLDEIIKRFGKKGAKFSEYDEEHFLYENEVYKDFDFYNYILISEPNIIWLDAFEDLRFYTFVSGHTYYLEEGLKKGWGDTTLLGDIQIHASKPRKLNDKVVEFSKDGKRIKDKKKSCDNGSG